MPSTIKKGSTGSDVVLCQERLNVHHYPVTVDGIFGSGTEAAVLEFQSDHNLVPDGIVGPLTWDALLAAPATHGAPPYDELDELSRRMMVETAWFAGWDYASGSQPSLVAQPSRLSPSNVVWTTGLKTKTVCCVFVAGVVGRVYDKTAQWSANAWQRFMVPASEPWGMNNECVAAGIGVAYSGTPQVGKWYVAQGWNDLQNGQVVTGSKGHQWLQWGPDLLVEANTYTDEDADGSSTDPGAVAWRHRAWSSQSSKYQEIRLVELLPA